MFRVFWKVFRGVPGFLEGVPGRSGLFTLFRVFRGVPVFRVPVFRCSGVPDITTCPFYGTNAGTDSTDLSM